MQSDPLYPHIENILTACPLQAGPLFTTFKDLSLSVEWRDLRVVELAKTGWAVIIGRKRKEDNLRAVLPLPLHTTALKPSSLSSIFSALSTLDISSIPALPPLAPTLDSLRKELAIRRGDQLESEPDSANRDGVSGSAPGNEVQSESLKRTEDEEKTTQMQAELDTEMLYMAIVATDSTVVYYKLTKGIKKPADIPDE